MALEGIRDGSTPPPTAADDSGRSAQRFELVVQLVQDGATRTARVRGRDIHAVTAPIVIEAALRLQAPSCRKRGALALAEAVDPVELLRALDGRALDVVMDALPGGTPSPTAPSTAPFPGWPWPGSTGIEASGRRGARSRGRRRSHALGAACRQNRRVGVSAF